MIFLEIKTHIPEQIFFDILMICCLKTNPLKDAKKCLRGKKYIYIIYIVENLLVLENTYSFNYTVNLFLLLQVQRYFQFMPSREMCNGEIGSSVWD